MSNNEIKVLFIGSTAIIVTEFITGYDVDRVANYSDDAKYFISTMKAIDNFSIRHIPNHLINQDFPNSKEVLSQYDVVILSDCGRNNLEMYPDVNVVPMGPDRLNMVANYVQRGGSLVMAGGWKSFQGFKGSANYAGSKIEEILPVNIQPNDDRIEVTEGIQPQIFDDTHPIFAGIPGNWPRFLGYNKLKPKVEANVIATIGDKDPFIALGTYGEGASMAFSSGIAPHWGVEFVKWQYYSVFWKQAITWLCKKNEF
jgi:uncharacterized membrane protein